MAKIQIGGSGGTPSNNFIRSMRESLLNDYLIGTSCVPSCLFLADVYEKYVLRPRVIHNYALSAVRTPAIAGALWKGFRSFLRSF